MPRWLVLSILVPLSLNLGCTLSPASNEPGKLPASRELPWDPVATFSILGYDPETGEVGGAVQSRVFSVGNGVLWAEAGVGAVATQAIVDVSYGPQGLELLRKGLALAEIVRQIWDSDPDPRPGRWTKQGRQFAVMNARGEMAAFTGSRASTWAGDKQGRYCTAQGNILAGEAAAEKAVALARTGGYFSNDQAPLSSRTVRFISGINFPPGIKFQPVAALYGIENSNRGCDLNTTFNPLHFVPRPRSLRSFLREEGLETGDQLPCNYQDQRGCSPGPYTGKFSGEFRDGRLGEIPDEELFDKLPQQVHGGGIPIFKDCRVAGGIGVFGTVPDHAEFAALVGSLSGNPAGGSPRFGPVACLPPPFAVLVEGVRLPFVAGVGRPAGTAAGPRVGGYLVTPRDGGVLAEGWLVPTLPTPEARYHQTT